MKKALVGMAVTVVSLCSVAAAPALADGTSGVPANCVGFTTAYTARGNDISPFVSANGIGNVAKANSVSTKTAVDYIKFVVCS